MGRIKGNTCEWIGVATCNMVLMVVDADSYDVFLGLDFLIKIGAVVDLQCKLIQVRQGPRTNVHVLPLNMVCCNWF
jgi:Ethanolamine utilization protein EutJ (predicted chaperonin)